MIPDFHGGPIFSTNSLPLQGSFGFGQKVLHEFLSTGPRKIMLLGPGQDSLAKSIAAYAGIPEVSLLQVRRLGNCVIHMLCFYVIRVSPIQKERCSWIVSESRVRVSLHNNINRTTGNYCSTGFMRIVILYRSSIHPELES